MAAGGGGVCNEPPALIPPDRSRVVSLHYLATDVRRQQSAGSEPPAPGLEERMRRGAHALPALALRQGGPGHWQLFGVHNGIFLAKTSGS